MNFISGASREENLLLPSCLDDYVSSDNPVRFIDAFVDGLNLKELGFKFPDNSSSGGRPSYHPGDLLKLLIYGYNNGIRSGRKLEKASQVNLEVIWLLKKLQPDFKTICDFRRNNRNCFKNVSAQFLTMCKHLKLISGQFIAVDGTVIKASNNPSKSWTDRKLQKALKTSLESVESYLAELEKLDEDPLVDVSERKQQIENKLKKEKSRQEKLRQVESKLSKSSKKHLAYTDPDCRPLYKNGRTHTGYNIQSAVDCESHLMLSAEVTNSGSDIGNLTSTVNTAAELIDGVDEIKVIADKGYYCSNDLKEAEERGYSPIVAEISESYESKGFYSKSLFTYNSENNTYICPAGYELPQVSQTNARGKSKVVYRNRKACENCPVKSRCTEGRARTVSRLIENEDALERNRERIKQYPNAMKLRACTVEHPFGTIKQQTLIDGFIVRGKAMVQAELSLAQLAYNIRRTLKLIDLKDLISYWRKVLSYFGLLIADFIQLKPLKSTV